MNYACLKQEKYQDQDQYQICAVRPEDIEKIRQWRNAQIEVLRQNAVISVGAQLQYYQTHVWPTFPHEKPSQVLFSFLLQEKCIGYGGLTRIDWENAHAEVSFLVDPLRAQDSDIYSKDFNHFLNMLCHVAFKHLQMHRLFTEAYAFRISTIDILEKYGFKKEGVLREHVFKNGQWIDSIMQGLLANEWQPR